MGAVFFLRVAHLFLQSIVISFAFVVDVKIVEVS